MSAAAALLRRPGPATDHEPRLSTDDQLWVSKPPRTSRAAKSADEILEALAATANESSTQDTGQQHLASRQPTRSAQAGIRCHNLDIARSLPQSSEFICASMISAISHHVILEEYLMAAADIASSDPLSTSAK